MIKNNILKKYPSIIQQISAIIVREIKSRYTGDILGYGWTYIAPLTWIGLIYIVFIIFNRSPPIDTDLGSFIISGMMPYLGFRYQLNAMLRMRAHYRNIINLIKINIRVIYLAIFIVELYNALLVYGILVIANYLLNNKFEIKNLVVWFFGFFLAASSGASLGFAISNNFIKMNSAARIMSVAVRFLFYITPIFYISDEIPQSILWAMTWNPLLHAIEILRTGAFSAYQAYVATAWVPIIFIFLCLVLGMHGELKNQQGINEIDG